jgi:hypothetical protein
LLARPLVPSEIDTSEMDGTTLDGTAAVNFSELVPISVVPLYVVQVMYPIPLVALGTCAASVAVSGVQFTEVLVVFVAIVPEAFPKLHVKVWVKEELARLIVIVPAVPIVKSGTVIDDALGIVVRAAVPVPDTLPRAVPENVTPLKLYENEKLAVFVPSALCVTVVEPLASVTVAPLLTPQDTEPLYSVPLKVTAHALAVDVEIRP